MSKTLECECYCDIYGGHSGKVSMVKVFGCGEYWGEFVWCETAIKLTEVCEDFSVEILDKS